MGNPILPKTLLCLIDNPRIATFGINSFAWGKLVIIAHGNLVLPMMDETTPLLPDEAIAPVISNDQLDRVLNKDIVSFDPDGDAENPMDWPKAYKWGIVALLAFMAFTVYVCLTVNT